MNLRSYLAASSVLISIHMRPLAAVALLAFPLHGAWAGYDIPALEKLEQQVRAVAEKCTPAVVAITYDSKFGMANGSGVVISSDGLVLTAAHVVNDRDQLDVVFTDGKRVHAKVLGADYVRDVAMVRMTGPGTYPWVELGDTKDLPIGRMVVAMGHPHQFDLRRTPPVRFGRVFSIDHDRFIHSDAIITGGDSGGPLFDIDGKLIGINSSKRDALTANFATPVEVVRQNWDRLLKGERWGRNPLKTALTKEALEELEGLDLDRFHERVMTEFTNHRNGRGVPLSSQNVGTWLKECGMKEEKIQELSGKARIDLANMAVGGNGSSKRELQSAPAAVAEQDDQIRAAVKPALDKLSPWVVSMMTGKTTLAMGTIIRPNGFILTKRSEIAKAKGELKVRLADGREFAGSEVKQFADHDLALVKIAGDSLPAVAISGLREPLDLGDFLFTPGSRSTGPMLAKGVVSVKERATKQGGGYLGIGLEQGKEGVEVGGAAPESPAAKAGLVAKDRILALNDKPVEKSEEFSAVIRAMAPGAKIQIKYRRGDDEKTTEVTLDDRSKQPGNAGPQNPGKADRVAVSDQATGFPLIFQHDQPLKPEECGGIIADLHGQVVGVNIARAGRVNSYAIPIGTVADLLKTVDFEALAK